MSPNAHDDILTIGSVINYQHHVPHRAVALYSRDEPNGPSRQGQFSIFNFQFDVTLKMCEVLDPLRVQQLGLRLKKYQNSPLNRPLCPSDPPLPAPSHLNQLKVSFEPLIGCELRHDADATSGPSTVPYFASACASDVFLL